MGRRSVAVLLLAWSPALAASAPTLSPAPAKTGDTVSLFVARAQKAPAAVVWDDHRFPFYRVRGGARALVPVPLTALEGDHALTFDPPASASGSVTVLPRLDKGEVIRFPPAAAALLNDPSEQEEGKALRTVMAQATADSVRRWKGPFLPPVSGELRSPFGVSRQKVGQTRPDVHLGVDFKAKAGEPVRAPADGVVIFSKDLHFHGGTVVLSHGQGVCSLYIHLSERPVRVGQKVKRGATIGLAGSSGLATGPHLHWGVYVHAQPVDPVPWLATSF